METVNRNIHALLNSIQKCQIYKDFKKQEEILNKNPELAERVQRFRAENFRLQNEEGQKDVLAKAEQLSRESEELRSFPEVKAYLDAELALCRMMQKICRTLTDGVEMNIPVYCFHLYVLCLHDDRKNHRASLGTFPEELAECILNYVFDLSPVCDISVQTGIKCGFYNFFSVLHKIPGSKKGEPIWETRGTGWGRPA